jgi:hypothetical protein
MEDVGIFMAIWSILWPFGICFGHLVYYPPFWYILPILVCCTKKNLATLVVMVEAPNLLENVSKNSLNKNKLLTVGRYQLQARSGANPITFECTARVFLYQRKIILF